MISLEHLADGSVADRNFERLAASVRDASEDRYKIALPFAANWGDYGSPNEGASFSRHGRLVVLQGLVTKSGTPASGNAIGTLPEGFRPVDTLHFAVATGGTDAFGRVSVDSAGVIKWISGSTVETDFTSLAGVVFAIG